MPRVTGFVVALGALFTPIFLGVASGWDSPANVSAAPQYGGAWFPNSTEPWDPRSGLVRQAPALWARNLAYEQQLPATDPSLLGETPPGGALAPELVPRPDESRRELDEAPPGGALEPLPVPSGVATEEGNANGTPPVVIEEGIGEIDGYPYIWGEAWEACITCCDCGLFGGVEATFLAPVSEPTQTVTLTDFVKGDRYTGSTEPSLGVGVRTWIGLQRCGMGFRVGYWGLANDYINVEPPVPEKGQVAFNEQYHLAASTLDIELIQRFPCLTWKIDTSFGARWARLEREGTVVGFGDVGNGVSLTGLATGSNLIEGMGFTASIGSNVPLISHPCGCVGECQCPPCHWFWFWNFRGSVLWSDGKAFALTEATAVTKNAAAGFATSRDSAFVGEDLSQTVSIAGLQLGVEYQRCLTCLPATCFIRGGFEYQHWDTGDMLAQSDSFALLVGGDPQFGGGVDARARAHDGNLDLLGFFVGAGLTY